MILGGLQKTTLIDYPGKVAATVFTVGCNFRCPFCHNPELVIPSAETGSFSVKEFFSFLSQRTGKLDGVCITGGEPTIQPDLTEFIRKIKNLGFSVKLDSNGTRPDILRKLLKEKLVDFLAMDVKSSLSGYDRACGIKTDKKRIKLSIDLIKNSRIEYEFRTTVVPGIHRMKDFELIGKWLKGSKKYVLQEYQDQGKILDESRRNKFKKTERLNLEKVKENIQKYFEEVEIR